jgi:hypothetical protein
MCGHTPKSPQLLQRAATYSHQPAATAPTHSQAVAVARRGFTIAGRAPPPRPRPTQPTPAASADDRSVRPRHAAMPATRRPHAARRPIFATTHAAARRWPSQWRPETHRAPAAVCAAKTAAPCRRRPLPVTAAQEAKSRGSVQARRRNSGATRPGRGSLSPPPPPTSPHAPAQSLRSLTVAARRICGPSAPFRRAVPLRSTCAPWGSPAPQSRAQARRA